MRKLVLAAVAATPFAAGPAFAAGTDYSSLTGAVDATALVTGLLAVGAIMIGPRVARMGINWIKGSVK